MNERDLLKISNALNFYVFSNYTVQTAEKSIYSSIVKDLPDDAVRL